MTIEAPMASGRDPKRPESRNTPETLVFLGNGRCYHTVDWFRSATRVMAMSDVVFVTDLVEGESFERLLTDKDNVVPLIRIDRVLFRRQSRGADIWRNTVKLLVLPAQVMRLRRICKLLAVRQRRPVLLYAHSMYYLFMAWLSGRKYIGTPQGSEILVRPRRSRLYRWFAKQALRRASVVTVDSVAMREAAHDLFAKQVVVIQNGLDLSLIRASVPTHTKRGLVVSVRAIAPNYRIQEIVEARNSERGDLPMTFCYPFVEEGYKDNVWKCLKATDRDLGRLGRGDLYRLLAQAYLVLSIPQSDSSPRSIYEAIFCGAVSAVTHCDYVLALPHCMRSRVIVVDISEPGWLSQAADLARAIAQRPFRPSIEALECFDQDQSMMKVLEHVRRIQLSADSGK